MGFKMKTNKTNKQKEDMESKINVQVQVKTPKGTVEETKEVEVDLTKGPYNTLMTLLSLNPADAKDQFGWVDDDGDFIRINSEDELALALAEDNCKFEMRKAKTIANKENA